MSNSYVGSSRSTPPQPVTGAPVGPGSSELHFEVHDVFQLTGRGAVLAGLLRGGALSIGQDLRITRAGHTLRTVRVKGIEKGQAQVASVDAGPDGVSILVDGDRSVAQRGDVLIR